MGVSYLVEVKEAHFLAEVYFDLVYDYQYTRSLYYYQHMGSGPKWAAN